MFGVVEVGLTRRSIMKLKKDNAVEKGMRILGMITMWNERFV